MRVLLLAIPMLALSLSAQEIPFVPDDTLKAITSEISGEMAQRNLEGISREHRMRGSKGYRAAAELVVAELERYGYADARIERFPADGTIFYGTQRSRPAWNAEFAELWEIAADGRRIRLADWSAEPLTLAQDSISGEAAGLLVDVGAARTTIWPPALPGKKSKQKGAAAQAAARTRATSCFASLTPVIPSRRSPVGGRLAGGAEDGEGSLADQRQRHHRR